MAQARKSKKASVRVTTASREAAAKSRQSKATQRGKAAGSRAADTASQRQFEKTRARAIQAHIQGRGQRRQAKRDSR
jgi:hypothetical protein